jgi:arabinogalactan endo-1,4-beta-galactosidase
MKKFTNTFAICFDVFTGFIFFLQYVQKYSINIKDLFAKGADVGWLPQMEATGYKFYDVDGTEKDCLQL